MRLKIGERAPLFRVRDFKGKIIETDSFKGSALLISFFRYAACPFCNLRVHQMIRAFDRLHGKNLNIISIFQSPSSSISEYVGNQEPPFPIIGDPKLKLYKQYGLEQSWFKFLLSCLNPLNSIRAIQKGLFNIHPEGPVNRLPADFLVDGNGIISNAYYAKTAADHIPLSEVEKWLDIQNL